MDFSKYILPVGGLVALYFVAKKFGILPSEEKRHVKAMEKLPASANVFDRNFKVPKGSLILTPGSAEKVAKNLYKSFGLINDDEVKVYGIFRSLTTQTQVVSLSIAFYKLYGKDLYYFLQDKLSTKELSNVLSIIRSKPKMKLK